MDRLASEIAALRSALLRFAHARLRNAAWADDAVSETIVAALEARPAFDDPVQLRSWLFGVLRHKIVDQFREHAGVHALRLVGTLSELDEVHPQMAAPADEPWRRVLDGQFLVVLERELQRLPKAQSRAFVLRECLGEDTPAVCAELGVSPGNLWVLMHRARSRLREGLMAFAG